MDTNALPRTRTTDAAALRRPRPARGSAAPLRLEVVSDTAALLALRAEWQELLSNSDAEVFFLSWDWLFNWWLHLGGRRRLHVVCVRSGGRLVAVMPLVLAWRRAAFVVGHPCLEFLGSGVAGSDYLDLIVRRGWEDEALTLMVAHLSRAGHALDLRRVRDGSAFAETLAAALASRGFRLRRSPDGACPSLALAGHDWGSFVSGLGREHRYNLRRKLRRLAREHACRLELVRAESERGRALAELIGLHRARFRDRERSEAFASAALVAFHETVTRRCLEQGWLRLFLLRLDGRAVAGLYGFRYGPRFYFYQSGFDPAAAPLSPGLVTMGLAIRSAIEEGVEEFDLLHGEEAYKRLWASRTHALVRLELAPPGRAGALWSAAARLERAARRAARRLLDSATAGRLASSRGPRTALGEEEAERAAGPR